VVSELYAILILAFGLGLVHALDADHIAAVSVLSSDKSSMQNSVGFAFQWATGHGLVLMLMTLFFVLIGEALPQLLSEIAERLVGSVLILLGLIMIVKIQRYRLGIHFHAHDGYMPHAHWYQKSQTEPARHKHKAVLVGGLHGMAGSAPLLGTLPVIKAGNTSDILFYILIFSAGVFIAMISFGGVFALGMKKIISKSDIYLKVLQISVAFISIAIGVRLVSG